MFNNVIVLVVEDTKAVREAIVGYLTETGAAVHAAEDGMQALKFLFSKVPDIVIADINMPGIDGLKFTQALREKPNGKNTDVVFLTASHDARDVASGVNLGAKHFLSKPISKADLLKKVMPLLEKKAKHA